MTERRDLKVEFIQWMKLVAKDLPLPTDQEFRFHPVRRWRLDLVWHDDWSDGFSAWDRASGVAVELHGGVHSHGRHTRGDGFTKDREKMNEAQLMGWIVLEFPSHVMDHDPDYCMDQLARALRMKGII